METKKIRRVFSTEFKKEKVGLIELGKLSVREISQTYEVSVTSVYKWLYKFGKLGKSERVVVEKISEENKNVSLLKKIAELERTIGQQQMQLIYKDAVIQKGSEHIGADLEKKFNSQQ